MPPRWQAPAPPDCDSWHSRMLGSVWERICERSSGSADRSSGTGAWVFLELHLAGDCVESLEGADD